MFFFSRNVTSFLYNIHRHSVIRSLPETLRMNKTVHIWAFKTATGSLVFCILLVTEQEKKYIYMIILYGYTTETLQKWEPSATQEHANFFSIFLISFLLYTWKGLFCFPSISSFFLLPIHFQMSSFTSTKIRVARNAWKGQYLCFKKLDWFLISLKITFFMRLMEN